MTINNNNPTPSLELFFSLTPPGSEGDKFGKLATDIHGVPIGDKPNSEALVKFLGFSDKDTIGSALDEILQLASQLNVSLVASTSSGTLENYLNTLDPTQPNVPPIKAFIAIAERDLQSGKIGGFQVSTDSVVSQGPAVIGEVTTGTRQAKSAVTEAQTQTGTTSSDLEDETNLDKAINTSAKIAVNVEDATANLNTNLGTISFEKTSGGNKWLAGNVYVAFLVDFMEMQRMLMQNKVVQGEVELNGMNLTVELAKTTADIIMNVAKTQQMIHIVSAVMAAVSICITIGAFAFAAKGSQTNAKGEMANPKAFEIASMISTLGSQTEKLATSATQAATDITIAEKEGRKEVLQAYRTIAQHQMDKGAEAFKASEDAIVQLLQALDKIRDGLQQAVANALRK